MIVAAKLFEHVNKPFAHVVPHSVRCVVYASSICKVYFGVAETLNLSLLLIVSLADLMMGH